MAAYPIDRRYVVTAADHGNHLILGNCSPSSVGVWSVCFAPSEDWVGTFQLVARQMNRGTNDDTAGFGGIGYIRQQVNLAAGDYGLTNDIIEGHATILVPAAGLSIAIATERTAGTCMIYSTPLEGDVSPTSVITV